MLVKTLFFYIAITMESFIFCFAGEYLSNKVSNRKIVIFIGNSLDLTLHCVTRSIDRIAGIGST